MRGSHYRGFHFFTSHSIVLITTRNTATVDTDLCYPDLINNLSEYVMNQSKWWLPVIQLFLQ